MPTFSIGERMYYYISLLVNQGSNFTGNITIKPGQTKTPIQTTNKNYFIMKHGSLWQRLFCMYPFFGMCLSLLRSQFLMPPFTWYCIANPTSTSNFSKSGCRGTTNTTWEKIRILIGALFVHLWITSWVLGGGGSTRRKYLKSLSFYDSS